MKTRKLAIVQNPQPKQTREELMLQSRQQILKYAEWDDKAAKKDLVEFSEKLAKSPAYALSWSASAFQAAAKVEAAAYITQSIESLTESLADEYGPPSFLKVLEVIREGLLAAVVRGGRYPERSTSPQSNVMAQDIVAAKGEWLDKIEAQIRMISKA